MESTGITQDPNREKNAVSEGKTGAGWSRVNRKGIGHPCQPSDEICSWGASTVTALFPGRCLLALLDPQFTS